MTPSKDDEIKEADHVFDGVHVRVYDKIEDHRDLRPALVWIHGGGWVFGSIDASAATARLLCKKANVVVFSVGYRLAPEHRFPAAFDDCVAAMKFCIRNSSQFGVDPTRIGVGGDSAGANLAAAVCLKLREDAFQPPVRLQLLAYPNLQGLNFQLPSMLRYANGPVVCTRDLAFFSLSYLEGIDNDNDKMIDVLLKNGHVDSTIKKTAAPYVGVAKLPAKYLVDYKAVDNATDKTVCSKLQDRVTNQYFSPLMAQTVERLPQAFVLTVEHDPRRDEGLIYIERLRQARVDVTHYHSEIGFHGIVSLAGMVKEADDIVDQMLDYLRNRL